MVDPLPGQPSCPACGARATARSKACARCGYPFVEDSPGPGRPRRRPLPLAPTTGAVAALAAGALAIVLAGGEADDARPERSGAAADAGRTGPELLSRRPLSARAVERRLEERFVSVRDDDSASARCSALQPRPAHAIRWCRIRYTRGGERTVIVLSNPQGYELLLER